MVNSMLQKMLSFAGLAVLTSAMASAQLPKSVQNNNNIQNSGDAYLRFGSKVLFTNLTGTHHGYYAGAGYYVDGANFFNQVLAQGFTPSQSATFADVVMPVGIATGTKGRINIFLYDDVGGAPGSAIDGPLHASSHPLSFYNGRGGGLVLYACFSCPALSAGTQYWVVAYEKAAEVQLTWDFANTDLNSPFVYNQSGSLTGPWLVVDTGFLRAAYEVDGN